MGYGGLAVILVILAVSFAMYLLSVYFYFRNRGGTDAEGLRSTTPPSRPRATSNDRGEEPSSSAAVCPHCGATNDASYTYCRGCAGSLRASAGP